MTSCVSYKRDTANSIEQAAFCAGNLPRWTYHYPNSGANVEQQLRAVAAIGAVTKLKAVCALTVKRGRRPARMVPADRIGDSSQGLNVPKAGGLQRCCACGHTRRPWLSASRVKQAADPFTRFGEFVVQPDRLVGLFDMVLHALFFEVFQGFRASLKT